MEILTHQTSKTVSQAGSIQFCAAAGTIAAIYATAAFLPAAFPFVFVGLVALWVLVWPAAALLLLFPSILPFANVPMLGMANTTAAFIFTSAIVVVSCWRPAHAVAMVRSIPRYALVGALGLLAVETISAGLSPSPTSWQFLGVRVTRTAVFLAAVATAGRSSGVRQIMQGWMLFGLLSVLASAQLVLNQQGVTALRTGEAAQMASLDGLVALVAGIGYCAVGSAWMWFASGTRRSAARLFCMLIGTACLASAFYSGRRQAIMATVLALSLAATAARSTRAGLGVVAAALLVLSLYVYGPLGELIEARGTPLGEFGEMNTGYLPIHEAGLRAFVGAPILGIGLANYSSATQALSVGAGDRWAAAHSSVIRVMAETGIVGATMLSILLVGFGRCLLRAVVRASRPNNSLSLSTVLPLFGVVLTGLTVQFLESHEYNYLFGQAIGLLLWDTNLRPRLPRQVLVTRPTQLREMTTSQGTNRERCIVSHGARAQRVTM